MENLTVLLVSVLSLAALIASLTLMWGLFPLRIDRIRDTLEKHWKRSFWIGLLNTVLITLITFGLAALGQQAPVFYIPTFAVYGVFLVGLLYGLTAFSEVVGGRLFPDLTPIKRLTRGGAVFLLAGLLPFAGWFLLFPYGICLAVGATVITLFQKKQAEDSQD